MWKGKGRSGYGKTSTLGDYDDWSCLSRNGRQWKNPITMETRDLSGADYWHMRKQLTDSYDVPAELYAVNETVNLAHTLPSGKANLAAYGDPAPVRKRIFKVSIKDKILPQFKRLQTLRSQMVELEREYKTTDMSISEYSVLRDVLVTKVQRAEVLYHKAIAQKPVQTPEEEEETYVNSSSTPSDNNGHGESYSSPVGVEFIDELSDQNSFKKILQKACVVARTLVRWHQATRNYIKTLSEV